MAHQTLDGPPAGEVVRATGSQRAWLNPPRKWADRDPMDPDGDGIVGSAGKVIRRRGLRRPQAVVPDIPGVEPLEDTAGGRLWHATRRHATAFRRYFSIRTNDLAAVVAFNGLIAVVPMFLLVVAIAGILLRDDSLFIQFRKTVISVLPSEGAREALRNATASRQNAGWFGVLSLVGFAWIGSSFVATVTRAINTLYDVRGAPFVRSRLRAVLVIVLFSVFLMAVILTATIPTLFVFHEVEQRFPGVEDLFLFQALGQAVSYALALVFAFLLFLIAYRYLPSVRHRFRDVVPGALVAAIGLVVLMQVFPIYVRIYQSLPSSSTYGAAFVFVTILVTWAYALAHVLLIGAWLNARAEERRRVRRALTIDRLDRPDERGDAPAPRAPLAEPPAPSALAEPPSPARLATVDARAGTSDLAEPPSRG